MCWILWEIFYAETGIDFTEWTKLHKQMSRPLSPNYQNNKHFNVTAQSNDESLKFKHPRNVN